MKTLCVLTLFAVLFVVSMLNAQPRGALPDTLPGHQVATSPLATTPSQDARVNFIGLDVLLSNGGVGLGTFYRHEYSDVLASYIDFSISEAKDDDEREYIDYFGNPYTPGKVNRFLVLPLFVGLQQRLFKDDIVDNFRPYINLAAGPTMIYVFPYNDDYITALGKGTPKYTVGAYAGFGAYFGSERANILGVNIRYYYLPYPKGLESLQGVTKKQFGGFYITVNFGSPI